MKLVLPLVMVVGAAMYVVIFLSVDRLNDSGAAQWSLVIAGVWNLLLLTATIVAIIDSVGKLREGRTADLATSALVVKVASVPFFVLNGAMLALLFVGGGLILLFGGFVLWIAVAIGSGLTYLALLSTSVYSWAAIAQLRREGIVKTWLTVLYVVMSLFYVTDIAAAILLFGHYRRRPRLALVGILLAAGLLMLISGIVMLGFGAPFDASYDDAFFLASGAGLAVAITGLAVIFATGVVTFVQRGSMLREARQAARSLYLRPR